MNTIYSLNLLRAIWGVNDMIDIIIGFIAIVLIIVFIHGGYLLHSDSQRRYEEKKQLTENWTDKERFENSVFLTPKELESVQRSNWERLKKEHPAILKDKD